jgi:hypothetical protein
LSIHEWRKPSERAELVNRVVSAEKRARIAEAKANAALSDHPRDEITHLAVRVIELEDTVARQNRTIAQLNERLTRRRKAS